MKIIYLANSRIPTEKAHGLQIVKMCEAFALAGHELDLWLPQRINVIPDNLFSYYGVRQIFNCHKLFIIDTIKFFNNKIGFLIENFFFALAVLVKIKKIHYQGVVYSRDYLSLALLSYFKNIDLYYEMHAWPEKMNFLYRRLFKKVRFVAISQGLAQELLKLGIPASNILVVADGVDLNDYYKNISKDDARKKTNLPLNKKIVLYAGHLYKWKGGDTLAKSAKYFDDTTLFVFVGGTDTDLELFKEKYFGVKNILIVGQKAHAEIPFYLSSADVLVIPNSGKVDVSRLYTSPMKLFEYMASERPIIASDLPSLREVLNENNAVFFEPDNAKNLALTIEGLLVNKELMTNISRNAKNCVLKYSWQERVKKIINFINENK